MQQRTVHNTMYGGVEPPWQTTNAESHVRRSKVSCICSSSVGFLFSEALFCDFFFGGVKFPLLFNFCPCVYTFSFKYCPNCLCNLPNTSFNSPFRKLFTSVL
uniref:Uncharacterized protein n=1 Tax=Cacopsylla melanoneura TaxID=428564 RepID=A0A8D8SGD8_9HEMI